jgi:hypothetical protein
MCPSYSVPAFGTSIQTSDLNFLLTDSLNSMGDYLTQEVGSLNWIECMTNARALATAKQFVTLLANQLSPNSASIFLNRWAAIYNTTGLSSVPAIESYIEQKQAQFGTPPSLSNLNEYFQDTLGEIFINLQVAPELQPHATTDPAVQIVQDGLAYNAPLTTVFVYVWQPRDNQDNLLMPNNQFNSIVESYHQFIEQWNPAYIVFKTMNLTNRGFQDGYGNGYNGLSYNNYLDGYNVISGTSGSATITGVGTAFKLYPNGQIGDFKISLDCGFNPPIQVVDDSGVLQTYYVESVSSNTGLTLTTNLINNITSRTYRCLGQVLDTVGMLDGGQLSASGWNY